MQTHQQPDPAELHELADELADMSEWMRSRARGEELSEPTAEEEPEAAAVDIEEWMRGRPRRA